MRHALFLVLLLQADPGRTREAVYDESRPVEVRPAVSTADRHVTCVVTFPEESIETLVAAWNDQDLSIERRRGHLFIKLFKAAEGDLHVLGASGALYRLYLRPAAGEPDGQVRIVRPAAEAKRAPAALEFVRAMRLASAHERISVRRAPDGVLFRTGPVAARPKWVYDSTHHLGYVVEVENAGDAPAHIDPRRFAGPDLVLVGVRDAVVAARSKTLLYFVFWR